MKTFRLASTMHPEQTCTSFSQFLVYNKSAPSSTAGTLCLGSRCLASWENLVCPSRHRLNHTALPFFTQRASTAPSVAMCFIIHFSEFLTAGGWEAAIQLHLDKANSLGRTMKRSFPCLLMSHQHSISIWF